MKYRRFGHSNLKVSELCLGTMTFGEQNFMGAPREECRRVFERFLAAGGNFFDTANIYQRGTSEQWLGEFAGSQRDSLVIASKYSFSMAPRDPNSGGNHRKNLVHSLDATLRRLKTDYLDILWVHGWDKSCGMADLMRALDDQVRHGKVLHLGISNAPAWVVASANTYARERGLTPFTALQMHYNLVERSIEREFFDLAVVDDMALAPWSPLAGGLLTGKYTSDEKDATVEGRLKSSPMGARTLRERNLDVARSLSGLARAAQRTPAQMALAWLMQRSAITSVPVIPVIGARTITQLEDNLGALVTTLGASDISALDALAAPAPEYPGSLLASEFYARMMFGETANSIGTVADTSAGAR
jgi:aryl-alcohol dehydrogenase-like predicted oxidoreductase